MLMRMSLLLAQEVNFTPDFDAIPGAGPVQQLINGIGAFALLLSLVGIIIGGGITVRPSRAEPTNHRPMTAINTTEGAAP